MADGLKPVDSNVDTSVTPNLPIDFDEVAGKLVQRVKVGIGPDGAYADVNDGNRLPVVLPGGAVAKTITNAVASGAVAAGAISVTFDIADADGASILGTALRNRIIPLSAPPGRTLPAISYVATALATILIVEMR